MSESIELQVNLNTLVQAGWCVEMETGLRGGQIRSWVKLRHFEHAKTHKIRAAPLGLSAAIKVAMADVGLAPFEHSPAPTHETLAPPADETVKQPNAIQEIYAHAKAITKLTETWPYETSCGCYNCSRAERRMSVMIVCPKCGNKRCPRGTSHLNDCTGSNEPGQIGSRYRSSESEADSR